MTARRHRLLGDETLAAIAEDGPWTYGRLFDVVPFERFRPVCTEPDGWDDDDAALDDLLSEVHAQGGFTLRDLTTGRDRPGFRLFQEDDVVWFRL